jgi:hypothetical protein
VLFMRHYTLKRQVHREGEGEEGNSEDSPETLSDAEDGRDPEKQASPEEKV